MLIYIVPIHILRYPDRKVQSKPLQAERINPFPTTLFSVQTKPVHAEQASLFPTAIDFSTGKIVATGRSMIAPTTLVSTPGANITVSVAA